MGIVRASHDSCNNAQDNRQERPGMIVQTVVVAGLEPVDIETEPWARHDPQAIEVERTVAPMDRFPAPELKSRASKALFMTVWRPRTRSAEHSCGIRQG